MDPFVWLVILVGIGIAVAAIVRPGRKTTTPAEPPVNPRDGQALGEEAPLPPPDSQAQTPGTPGAADPSEMSGQRRERDQ